MVTLVVLLLLFDQSQKGIIVDKSGIKNGHAWRIQIETSLADPRTDRFGTVKVAPGPDTAGMLTPTINGFSANQQGPWDVIDDEVAHWRRNDSTGKWAVPWLIRNFVVWIDRQRIAVPKKYWGGVLDVGHGSYSAARSATEGPLGISDRTPVANSLPFGQRSLQLFLNDDASGLQVNLFASSLGDSEVVTWTISKKGTIDRSFGCMSP